MTEYLVQVRKIHAGGDLYGAPLTYRYGSLLRAGDKVACPANEYSAPFIAEVVDVGSDYQGPTRALICRVAPDRKRP